jgi:DNA-binding GntR family transcriptional regulator
MAVALYEVRGILEALAAKLAAEKIDHDTLGRMKTVLKKQASIVDAEDLLAYSDSDFDFHSLIYESTGNWLLKETLDNIKTRSRPLLCNITPILCDLYQDHLEVLEAFQTRDGARAEKAMFEHNLRMRRCIEASRGQMVQVDSNHWTGDE